MKDLIKNSEKEKEWKNFVPSELADNPYSSRIYQFFVHASRSSIHKAVINSLIGDP